MTRPGTKINKAKHERAICPGCRCSKSLKRDGTFVQHQGDRLQRQAWGGHVCSGVGRKPEVA